MNDNDKPFVFNPETGETEEAESFDKAIERIKELADTQGVLDGEKPN